MSITIEDVKQFIADNDINSIELYRYISNAKKSIHTDNIKYIDNFTIDKLDDEIPVSSFTLMNADEYDATINANSCCSTKDYDFEDTLVVMFAYYTVLHETYPKLFKATVNTFFDGLDNMKSRDELPCFADFHSEIFNDDKYYIYYDVAEKDLLDLGVWGCIATIQRYEKSNFGEIYTDLSSSVDVANMCMYILGYELMNAIYTDTQFYDDLWNESLTHDDLNECIAMAIEWFDDNGDLETLWNEI